MHAAQEYQDMVHELRRQVDEQPDKEKLLWKRQLSQQADYRAEIQTPNRPTSSGLQSPVGAPVQLGPSPMTREYSATPPGNIPPAQWGDFYGRAGDDGCELFGVIPNDGEPEEPICPQPAVHQPDELHDARSPLAPLHQEPLVAARCVNGTLLRPGNAEEEQPSTACRQSEVCAPGGVPLGRGAPGQQHSPGGLRGRNLNPPPPPPPPPPPVPHASAAPSADTYPLQWTPLHTRPKAAGGGGPPGDPPNQGGGSASQGSHQGGQALGQEELGHLHQEEDMEEEAQRRGEPRHSSQEEEQVIQGLPHLHLQAFHNLHARQIHGVHLIDPGKPFRSSCYRSTTRHAAYWR